MLHEPVRLGAGHVGQGFLLLGQGGVKLVVAAAGFLHALDEGRQPVGRLQQFALGCGQQVPGDVGGDLLLQLGGQHGGHGGRALPLDGLVGVPQHLAAVFDRGGHIPGDDLGGVVIQGRHRHRLGAAGGAGVPPCDQAEGVGQQGGVAGVLAEGLGPGGVHQAPACDVLHAGQQGIEGIQHGNNLPAGGAASRCRPFCTQNTPLWGVCQGRSKLRPFLAGANMIYCLR